MNKNRTTISVLIPILIGMICVYWAYGVFQEWIADGFKDRIPSELKISETLLVDGDMGGLGWWGVAIFRLQSDTLDKLRATGLQALAGARRSKNKNSISGEYQEYSPWRETPYIETGDGMTLEDRWLGGMVGANMKPELSKSIEKALRSGGSYYAKSNDSGLVVIPSLGLVAYIYFD